MTKQQFTYECSQRCTGVIQMAAKHSLDVDHLDDYTDSGSNKFVAELLEQDSDAGSISGTKRVLGEELYAALQKFK
jgi:hypothetical protein